MPRPDSITNDDIVRWSNNIDNDPYFISGSTLDIKNPACREVLYAGLWLTEQLLSIGCSEENLVQIQYTAGRASYRRDPWEAHTAMLESYLREELMFEANTLH